MLAEYEGTEKTVEKTSTEETEKMSIIFVIFYFLSNLGGLYTFCILIIGIFLRPVIDKIFMHEIVNDYNKGNKEILGNWLLVYIIGQLKILEENRIDKLLEMERFGLLGTTKQSTDKESGIADQSYQEYDPMFDGNDQYEGGSGKKPKKSKTISN